MKLSTHWVFRKNNRLKFGNSLKYRRIPINPPFPHVILALKSPNPCGFQTQSLKPGGRALISSTLSLRCKNQIEIWSGLEILLLIFRELRRIARLANLTSLRHIMLKFLDCLRTGHYNVIYVY